MQKIVTKFAPLATAFLLGYSLPKIAHVQKLIEENHSLFRKNCDLNMDINRINHSVHCLERRLEGCTQLNAPKN